MHKSQMDIQLKEGGQLTKAKWATWLECSNDWELIGSYKINLKKRRLLQKFIFQPGIKAWLKGVLAGKRSRPRLVPEKLGDPGQKLFVFPNQLTQRVILVAAEELSEAARRFWQRVALGNSRLLAYDLETATAPLDIDSVPYYLPRAMDNILEIILKTVDCQGGWLAVRSGDYLEIKAHSSGPDYLDKRLSISGNPLLREIIQFRKAHSVKKNDYEWRMAPRLGFDSATKVWYAFPLIIGKRLIGMVAMWGKSSFSPEDVEKLNLLTIRIASSVEGNITFTDLSNHLHRMAYLNDFAVTVFSSQDLEQIVQRTFALLRRAFNTERIYLMTFLPDSSGMKNYYDHGRLIESETNSHASLPSQVYKGNIYRTDLINSESTYKPAYPGSQSALVIPLKYRKQVIGALGLESKVEGVFTINDEHLVAVIGSYIAGLLENGRLRQEAEARARNLSLIHEVVEKVIGETDVRQVAQIAAGLMAQNFNYELVVVALVRGPKKELQLAGIGGKGVSQVQNGLKSMKSPGEKAISMRVAVTGKSALFNNVSKDSVYLPIPGWGTGSDMCVALKEGDQSFGIIEVESMRKNAFSQNDLLVLESLGGILASVISNVGQYQKLQMTVKQLRATQEELQEHIAAQRMAERRLVQAAKLVAVGEMAAGIAHELNNPLTTVSGFTELTLEEVPPDSRLHTDLELVLREAHRATDVVRRLLDFTRQSDSVRMRSNINEIVKEVLALVNHLLHTSGVQLITHFPNGLPTVSIDRNQVKQVILNLIHNALHAMPNGGELRITTTRRSRDHQDWVIVLVSDTGIGIPPENLERIFEPFFTTRAKEGGTGLGLSISYGIIAEHGGFIEAESQVSKGSIFSIWIPVEVN
jgi:signal transduction histidine kinase